MDDTAATESALDAALLKKYGLQYRLIRMSDKKRPGRSVPLVITLA